jgi:hypothetical protein
LRERCDQRRDDPLLHRHLVTCGIYQLDWSALLMGVLPLRIRELAERGRDPLVKFIVGSLHPVAGASGIGAAKAFDCRYVKQQREVGNEAACRQTVRGSGFGLGKPAAKDLVCVRG